MIFISTQKKDKALQALLSCGTLQEAAELAGVAPRSIYTWLREDPAFRSAYDNMKSSCLQNIADKTASNAAAAVDTLKTIMSDDSNTAGARTNAARILLDNYVRLVELVDFEQRLSAVEESLSNR